MSTHLVIPDAHAHWSHNNDRASWLAQLIIDEKPDVVINMGDQFDFPSLSSYEKGKRDFQGRTYSADVNAGLDFSEKLFGPLKKRKKKLPRFVFLEGNHERRIEKALDLSPELEGTVSFSDLDLADCYDDIVRYSGTYTPGKIKIDGVSYAHFFVSGIKGNPVGGEHTAYTLITKLFGSCTAAHSHELDYCIRTSMDDKKLMGLVAGCYLDFKSDWAGETQKLWWKGVIIKRNVEDGRYDPEFISLEALRKAYGNSS